MKTPITHAELKAQGLNTPDAQAAYDEAKREGELHDLLISMKEKAGINSKELAQRLGITPPAITRLEKKPHTASLTTLYRYADACGCELKIESKVSHEN